MPDTTTQAARLTGDCQKCGSPSEGWAAQYIEDDRLRWAVDWTCRCGLASCDGGRGPAPGWIRGELLAQHGPARLELADKDARGGGVLKVFRDALGLSVREAHAAATELRQGGYVATGVEVHLLADLLRQAGIATAVRTK
ncbi:hypothetical protein [Kibdelosporangium phytohabitans]|uniref:Uncharacterized protein n=1 Tax=Kibdelosporangium phytohabitans TaxID=860235 RepID=A0A0N9I110_9PSEU|nr:hypothetical protein [Kibdelosporangium phytohabitans]ALG12001.1 hypothetical protein AOZ06_38620 [Kibdelosporangium phytohabitans]MBE1463471.1 hypothetical protein [Kibdelosporangium phytohabitans]